MATKKGMAVETVAIDSVTLDPANTRRHPSRNLDAIAGSLKRFGQQKPIVVDSKGIVRAGNGTLLAARAIGWKEISIVRSDLPLSEMAAFSIADNRTAELAEWDEEALLAALADPEIGDVGFDESEIEALDKTIGDGGTGDGSGSASLTLAERFGVPPFSILDARQGYWQDRKRAWLALGIQSEVGRGGQLIPNGGGMTSKADYERERESHRSRTKTS